MAAGRAMLWAMRSCTVHSGHEGTIVASSSGERSMAMAQMRLRNVAVGVEEVGPHGT